LKAPADGTAAGASITRGIAKLEQAPPLPERGFSVWSSGPASGAGGSAKRPTAVSFPMTSVFCKDVFR
jgi:hypothetical protein